MPAPAFLARLLGSAPDPRAAVRPLWHRIVELARAKPWYLNAQIADTTEGRFDAIALVLALVLLRMERGGKNSGGGDQPGQTPLAASAAALTELFVEDMDGQLREAGIGDLVVGKHVGRLMGVLGGRLGAYRTALASPDDADLAAALERNLTLRPGATSQAAAHLARGLAQALDALPDAALLAGEIPLPEALA